MVLLNKSDVIRSKKFLEAAQTVHHDAICISARMGLNLDKLGRAVLGRYRGEEVTVRLTADAGNGKVYSFLRANATITRQEYEGEKAEFEARLSKSKVAGLRRLKVDELEVIED